LEVKQGHGTFVRLPKIDVPEEAVSSYLMTSAFSLLKLIEVRTPIEVEVAKLAAERREEKHVVSMEKSLQTMRTASESVDAHANADEAFHRAIIDASANPLFGIMIGSIMGNLHIGRQLAIGHFGVDVVIKEHQAVYDAIKNKQPSIAAEKMRAHMNGAVVRINKVNDLLNK
jgi:DNA-binding FadR family transcriptional regulator